MLLSETLICILFSFGITSKRYIYILVFSFKNYFRCLSPTDYSIIMCVHVLKTNLWAFIMMMLFCTEIHKTWLCSTRHAYLLLWSKGKSRKVTTYIYQMTKCAKYFSVYWIYMNQSGRHSIVLFSISKLHVFIIIIHHLFWESQNVLANSVL